MALTQGSELLKATAVESFWNQHYGFEDPFEGLVYRRDSTQETDTYARLGSAPMPTQFAGDRNPKVANEYTYDVKNVPWDASVKVGKKTIKYQQWDEVGNLVGNLGMKARGHFIDKLTDQLELGFTVVGDDGQFFFDTDHAETGAEYTTNQDNDLTAAAATGTQPTDLELATAIRSCFDALYGFLDDRGHPAIALDDNPANWICMVPTEYRSVARRVQTADSLTGPVANDLRGTFTVRVNRFLANADRFFFFYAGSAHKPLILQTSGSLMLSDYKDPDSDDVVYSATWWGETAFGQWRTAVGYIFT